MGREVFQANKILAIGIASAVSIAITLIYLQTDVPIWVVVFVIGLAILLVMATFKTKVVIEHGLIRYEQVFGGEEVELKKVSQIVRRETETIVERDGSGGKQGSGIQIGKIRIGNGQQSVNQERRVEKVMYVLDDAGRTIFSFPANIIGFRHRIRFREAVQAVNPNIEVD